MSRFFGGVRELATDYRVTVDSATRKLLTPEDLHDSFGGPSGGDIRMVIRHLDKLTAARDNADRFRLLVEAFKTSKVSTRCTSCCLGRSSRGRRCCLLSPVAGSSPA